MNRRILYVSLLLGTAIVAGTAGSRMAVSGEVYLFRKEAPSASELADIMFPKKGEPKKKIRTRGIRFTDPATESNQAAPKAVEPEPSAETQTKPAEPPETATAAASGSTTDVPPEGASVGFNIRFALGSADLLPDSIPYLDAIGKMLTEERPDSKIEIAGHADASGPETLNNKLSEQRALAVARYLYEKFKVDPSRMQIVGYGESQPLPGTDPYDGVNRRVEFRPIE